MNTPIIHMPPKNAAGEHLDNVDLHLTVENGTAKIEIHAITSTFTDGVPYESTGRHLSTVIHSAGTMPDMDGWRSHKHLDEACNDWGVTPAVRWMLDGAAKAGMAAVGQ